ncbi:ABC-F family ATP-binding cassette domain-containing protein [Paracidovorax valerianellae]|uniref:ATPase components of ABC transporters with duplicated ATPase domains n=1 Tax=Paracidovorax valerianellae TaxID=187868 RepID=A0A1G6M059_9BURK|nr:ABC-F family ATP-binding cassette domain-containing protein [Paracidovorax valerianellae]MDA8446118.1 ATP-binding cassette domain-containing protein [Paracidovorax valerianellae]SDC48860.1 ATPase components of ABC transporters with duplicated ATPase domains [Paracidovorax valerianellae]
MATFNADARPHRGAFDAAPVSSSASVSVASLSAASQPREDAFLRLCGVQWLRADGEALWTEPLDLNLAPGITGLVGDNGVGKSVLLALAAGTMEPAAGSVVRQGHVHAVDQHRAGSTVAALAGIDAVLDALARLEAGQGNEADLLVAEGRWDWAARWQRALEGVGLGPLPPAHDAALLSGGERARIALAGAFFSEADVLLLDEPTNHLDAPARRWLLSALADWRGAVLVATHDRALLEVVGRIAELTPHGLRAYGGAWSVYEAQRGAEAQAAHAALHHARAERDAALRDLRRQHDAQTRRAARGRAAGKDTNQSPLLLDRKKGHAEAFAGREHERRQQVAERLDTAVRDAAGRVGAAAALALPLPGSAIPAGKPVLRLEHAVPPQPAHSRQPLDGVWSGPVRIAVTGPNGCGKTTLLRMVAGQLPPASGRVHCSVRTAWLDQHSATLLPPGQSVLERLAQTGSPLPPAVLRTRLAQLGLDAACVQRPAGTLSGGERIKAALACALWGGEPAQMLLLDEPTNHLDARAVQALQSALQTFTGALMVVSHDRHFLQALAPQVVWAWEGAGDGEKGGWNLDAAPQVALP